MNGASVTMPWFFVDEATAFTDGLLDALGTQVVWAPALWVLECTNVLQSAQRRRRIDAEGRARIAGQMAELQVRIDTEKPNFAGLDRLAAWKSRIGGIPLVGIGGISLERAPGVLAAGADSAAVVTDITLNDDPESRTRAWVAATRRAG